LAARKRKAGQQYQVHRALHARGPARNDGEHAADDGDGEQTIWVGPSPRISGPVSQMLATAIAGIVSPMLAIADPRAR